jgi:hypothetical protein
MKSRRDILVDLLHGCADGALATHGLVVPGFPFATALPFAVDERQRPVFLISRLAEHTQNLAADPRASLLVRRLLPEGEMVRATLVGNVAAIDAEPLLVARYLRYQPDGERFLQLGDFRFFRLEPLQTRVIGGFGQAGWLPGGQLVDGPVLALADEAELVASLQSMLPVGTRCLGVDCHGIDLAVAGARRRADFPGAPLAGAAIPAAAQTIVDGRQA